MDENVHLAHLRPAPPHDEQQDLFVPFLCDVPIKDEVNLMDISPFRLSLEMTACLGFRAGRFSCLIFAHTDVFLFPWAIP